MGSRLHLQLSWFVCGYQKVPQTQNSQKSSRQSKSHTRVIDQKIIKRNSSAQEVLRKILRTQLLDQSGQQQYFFQLHAYPSILQLD